MFIIRFYLFIIIMEFWVEYGLGKNRNLIFCNCLWGNMINGICIIKNR